MLTCEDHFAQQGWECPKCGRVYSPTTSMCMYCGNETVSVNTNVLDTLLDSAMRNMTTEEAEKALKEQSDD